MPEVTPSDWLPGERRLTPPYGVEVDTVGVGTNDERHGALRQTFSAHKYLQELRSTIRAMRSVVDRLT